MAKETLTTVLDLVGVALLVAGVALIYVPASFLVAGIGCLLVSWRLMHNPGKTVEGSQ